jgi:flagellar biosynthesis/type III secretory pathway protein FliH
MSLIFLQRLGAAELLSSGPVIQAASAVWISEASALIAAANSEAQTLVELAHAQADAIRERARLEGTAEGLQHGQAQIATQLATITASGSRYVRDLEPVLIDAVVFAVGKLIGEAGRSAVVARAALHVRERLGEAHSLTLRVSPALCDSARQAINDLMMRHGVLEPMRIEVDPTLVEDQCLIESSVGQAKLQFDEQLERLRQAFHEAFGRAADAT